jgi:hypothetical protein
MKRKLTFWRALSRVCSVWRRMSDKAFSNWRVRLAFSLDFSSKRSCLKKKKKKYIADHLIHFYDH